MDQIISRATAQIFAKFWTWPGHRKILNIRRIESTEEEQPNLLHAYLINLLDSWQTPVLELTSSNDIATADTKSLECQGGGNRNKPFIFNNNGRLRNRLRHTYRHICNSRIDFPIEQDGIIGQSFLHDGNSIVDVRRKTIIFNGSGESIVRDKISHFNHEYGRIKLFKENTLLQYTLVY